MQVYIDNTVPDTFEQSTSKDFTQPTSNDESQPVSDTTDSITPSVSSETSETHTGSNTTLIEKESAKNTRKCKKSKSNFTGDLLDKLISMQEK